MHVGEPLSSEELKNFFKDFAVDEDGLVNYEHIINT